MSNIKNVAKWIIKNDNYILHEVVMAMYEWESDGFIIHNDDVKIKSSTYLLDMVMSSSRFKFYVNNTPDFKAYTDMLRHEVNREMGRIQIDKFFNHNDIAEGLDIVIDYMKDIIKQ